jgi:metal transporter CNNM
MTYDILYLGCYRTMHNTISDFFWIKLSFFSLSRLLLEVETKQGHGSAKTILSMREDSNFLLSTILWATCQ